MKTQKLQHENSKKTPQMCEAQGHECRSRSHFIIREYAGSANSECGICELKKKTRTVANFAGGDTNGRKKFAWTHNCYASWGAQAGI